MAPPSRRSIAPCWWAVRTASPEITATPTPSLPPIQPGAPHHPLPHHPTSPFPSQHPRHSPPPPAIFPPLPPGTAQPSGDFIASTAVQQHHTVHQSGRVGGEGGRGGPHTAALGPPKHSPWRWWEGVSRDPPLMALSATSVLPPGFAATLLPSRAAIEKGGEGGTWRRGVSWRGGCPGGGGGS